MTLTTVNPRGIFHHPPGSFFFHLCLTYYLSSSSAPLPLSFSRFISVSLLNSICLSMIYPLQSQPSPLFVPVSLSLLPSSLCLFSPLPPVVDTESGTQIMPDIYKTGLARITFTHTDTHTHTNTNDSTHTHTNPNFNCPKIHYVVTSMWTPLREYASVFSLCLL